MLTTDSPTCVTLNSPMSRVPGGEPRDNPGDRNPGDAGASSARARASHRHGDTNDTSSVQDECLVWVPVAQDPPSDLIQSLGRRGVRARVRRDAMSIMSAACAMSSQAGREGFVVVFCQPSQLLGSGDVFRAMEKYAPRGRVWVYRRVRDEGELMSATRDEAASWPTLDSARLPSRVEPAPLDRRPAAHTGAGSIDTSRSAARPRLRLTGEQSELDGFLAQSSPTPDATTLTDAPNEGTRGDVLSAEELRMLLRDLGPDDRDPPRRNHPPHTRRAVSHERERHRAARHRRRANGP